MERELENELEPLKLNVSNFWDSAFEKLKENRDKVLPVFLEHSVTGIEIGSYYLRLIDMGENTFLQAEGFSSRAIEEGFIIGGSYFWKKLQPGIYQFNVTNIIKGNLSHS